MTRKKAADLREMNAEEVAKTQQSELNLDKTAATEDAPT